MDKWIDVNIAVPENGKRVLVFSDNGYIEIGFWNKEAKIFASTDGEFYGCALNTITHWMPLPERPKKEN